MQKTLEQINMAAVWNAGQTLPLPSKDMTNEDLHEFSNIFSSEFNRSDIHDRVLCFKMIENEEFDNKVDSEDDESESGSWSPKERGNDTFRCFLGGGGERRVCKFRAS
jgi:hypothetical protein